MNPPEFHAVGRSETQAVFDTMAVAFVADPVFRHWFRRPSAYLRRIPRMALALGEAGFDAAHVTATADFTAAAIWMPPGASLDLMAMRAPDDPVRTAEQEAASTELRAKVRRHQPTEPHWYLWMLGVDPARQGQGLGAALLKHTLRRVDEAGGLAYLESSNPRNVPLYERHGFEVMEVVRVGDIPPVTPMIRPARGVRKV